MKIITDSLLNKEAMRKERSSVVQSEANIVEMKDAEETMDEESPRKILVLLETHLLLLWQAKS